MSKKITLLGSTGSIGTQSLDVCRMHGYEVFGLSANSSVDKLLAQIAEFHPKHVAVTDPAAFDKLSAALAGQADAPKLLKGAEGLRAVYIGDSEVDLQTAQNAALPCISVSWGFRDRNVLVSAGAETICDDMDALYRALREG